MSFRVLNCLRDLSISFCSFSCYSVRLSLKEMLGRIYEDSLEL